MPDCVCLPGCPFFNDKMPDNEGMGAIYKKKYCQGEFEKCARYMVFKALGKGRSPNSLYPNMIDQAKAIIAKG
ncbi:MAG: hypothetical protein ACOYXC_00250 [Candidatus Rifleibacteriota bacterium]